MFSSTTTMAARSFLCCSTLLFASILLSPISCHALFSPGNATHKALFVFGDSLFDPGNNQYLNDSSQEGAGATVFPYGETYFKRPTGRLCDGRTVPDLIGMSLMLVNRLNLSMHIWNCKQIVTVCTSLIWCSPVCQFAHTPTVPATWCSSIH